MKSFMMKSALTLALATAATFASANSIFDNINEIFPKENYSYRPQLDAGFAQYATKSLYGTKTITLTYDDGPSVATTPALLDILKKYNVKATFFILTQNVNEKTRPIIERMLEEGHFVSAHGVEHFNSNTLTPAQYKANLKNAVLTLEKIADGVGVHQTEMYYRYPYGNYGKSSTYNHMNVMKEVSQEVYGENCINFAFWDIDTADWLATMTPEEIKNNVLANVVGGTAYDFKQENGKYIKVPYTIKNPIGGGIVLMHDIHARSVAATEKLLAEAASKSIKVVPLNEVEGYRFDGKSCVVK